MRFHMMAIVALTAIGFIGDPATAKDKMPAPTNGPDGLRYAAVTCDLPMLKSLIASGTSVSVPDTEGFDALSRASLNREQILFAGWGFKKPRATNAMTLTCPLVVAALTDAGADPWKGKFYQNPLLDEHRPKVIAVIKAFPTTGRLRAIARTYSKGSKTALRCSFPVGAAKNQMCT